MEAPSVGGTPVRPAFEAELHVTMFDSTEMDAENEAIARSYNEGHVEAESEAPQEAEMEAVAEEHLEEEIQVDEDAVNESVVEHEHEHEHEHEEEEEVTPADVIDEFSDIVEPVEEVAHPDEVAQTVDQSAHADMLTMSAEPAEQTEAHFIQKVELEPTVETEVNEEVSPVPVEATVAVAEEPLIENIDTTAPLEASPIKARVSRRAASASPVKRIARSASPIKRNTAAIARSSPIKKAAREPEMVVEVVIETPIDEPSAEVDVAETELEPR